MQLIFMYCALMHLKTLFRNFIFVANQAQSTTKATTTRATTITTTITNSKKLTDVDVLILRTVHHIAHVCMYVCT